jgi:hypothetical protein
MAIATMLETQVNRGSASIIQKFVVTVNKADNINPIYILKLKKF